MLQVPISELPPKDRLDLKLHKIQALDPDLHRDLSFLAHVKQVPISELPPKERLDLKLHKNQVLFSGTHILQHSQAAAAAAAAAPGKTNKLMAEG